MPEEEQRTETLDDLRAQITSLEQRLEKRTQEVHQMKADLHLARWQLQSSKQQARDNAQGIEAVQGEVKQHQRMSRWQHFRKALGFD